LTIEEKRHDRDLVPALDSATNDARAKRMQEIREQLTRPITVGEFRKLEKPYQSKRLRKHIFGSDEPFDFLRELRKRREAREAGETDE
jgi:hypothetical protein